MVDTSRQTPLIIVVRTPPEDVVNSYIHLLQRFLHTGNLDKTHALLCLPLNILGVLRANRYEVDPHMLHQVHFSPEEM